jgi:hypothetical protein
VHQGGLVMFRLVVQELLNIEKKMSLVEVKRGQFWAKYETKGWDC